MAADRTSVVSQPRKLQHLTSQWDRRHSGGAEGAPRGVVDGNEMSDVAAFLAAVTTDVLAAKAASGVFCPAHNQCASG